VIWANRKESDSLILGRKGNGFLLGISEKYSKNGDGRRGKLRLFTANGLEVFLENSPLRSLLCELISSLFSSSPAFFQNSFITLSAVYLNVRISHKNEVYLQLIVSVTLLSLFQRLRVGPIPGFSSFTSDVLRYIIKNGHLYLCLAYRLLFFQSFTIFSSHCTSLQQFYFVSVLSGKFIIISFAACSLLRSINLLCFSNTLDFLKEYITHLFSWDIKHCAVFSQLYRAS
jgi:hypothetical protein